MHVVDCQLPGVLLISSSIAWLRSNPRKNLDGIRDVLNEEFSSVSHLFSMFVLWCGARRQHLRTDPIRKETRGNEKWMHASPRSTRHED